MTDSSQSPVAGLRELVAAVSKEARQEFRGLRIKPDDVWGLPSRNVLLLLMYILMRERRATDWGTGRRPELHEIEPRQIQLHHIFPFDYMNKNKDLMKWYLDQGYSPADYRADVNDIANLTFLSQAKNVEIKENPPAQYLANETTPAMRKAHFIPEDRGLWKSEHFVKFLQERRRLLSKAMSKLLRQL